MGYRLTSEALRVIQSDEKGKVTYRRRYKKGQIVDTSKMDEKRVELFIQKGYLVDEDAEPEAEPEETEDGQESSEGSDGSEQATGDLPDLPEGLDYDELLAWVAEGEELDDRRGRASAVFAQEKENEDFDESAVSADLQKAVYGDRSGDDDSDVHPDKYTEMNYPSLQQEAKSRGLNGGGSADDLRIRLREDDETKQS